MRDTHSGGGVTVDTMLAAKFDTTSSFSDRTPTETGSPYNMSPWNQPLSPFARSPWSLHPPATTTTTTNPFYEDFSFSAPTGLVGSLVREEGHIYSLAASGELLYTGSESKNIRVWKNQKEYSGFKSTSGLVKAIVVSGDRIFTGHQDGKIRIWKFSNNANDQVSHKRVGSLPRLKDYLKGSFKPSNYVDVGRKRNMLWLKHYDVVSCLGMSEDREVLYSGSWDKTFKVWRIADSKCLESVFAHDDAVNSIVAGFGGLVFTGSADGTVKAWRREVGGRKGMQHVFVETLLKQESAVTALAVDSMSTFLYCGSSDGAVNFWVSSELALPKHGGVLRGHTSAVLCIATAGSLVLSGSADKNICVWKREVGVHTCVSVLSGHTGPVKCLAVEAEDEEGRWVVYSGSLDKSVKVWKVSEFGAEQMILPYSVASSRSDSYGNRVSHSSATSSGSRK